MAKGLAPRVIEGRVLHGGVAQDVTRRPGYVRVVLTVAATHPAATAPEGVTAVIACSEAVPVTAGTRVEVLIVWAGGGGMEYAGAVLMPCDTVLREAHVRR
jgi:hypothetical protein